MSDTGSTKLSRKFAQRYIELSLSRDYPKARVTQMLSSEFHIQEFTVKRLMREAQKLWNEYGREFIQQIEPPVALAEVREIVRKIVLSEGLFFSDGSGFVSESTGFVSESTGFVSEGAGFVSEGAGFVSEGFRLASQIKEQKVLAEKEATDAKFREYNKGFIVSLKKYFKSKQSKFHFGGAGIEIHGKDIHPDLNDLEIILVAKPQTGAGTEIMGGPYIGRKPDDPNTQVIVMPVVSTKSKNLLDIRRDFLDNFDHMEWMVSHEFGHYQDSKRYDKTINFSSADVERKKGVQAYFNTPEEWNQYYHDGIKKFKKYADDLKNSANFEVKKRVLPPSFSKFMDKFDLRPAPKKKFKDLKPWEMTKENFEEIQGDFIMPNDSSSKLETLPIVKGRLYRKTKIYKMGQLLQSKVSSVIKKAREAGYDVIKTEQSETLIVLNPKSLDHRTHKDFIKQALVSKKFIEPKAIIDYSDLTSDYDTNMDDLRDKVRQQMKQADIEISAQQKEEEVAVNRNTLNHIFRTDVIDSMTPQTRRRFVKRLSDFYPKIVDRLYTPEEKVAIEKEYAKEKKMFNPKKIKDADRLKDLQNKRDNKEFMCSSE